MYLRGVPVDLSQKLKAAAALSGVHLQTYIVQLLRDHVTELERKGQMPKSR
jgi:hypothetical protein